MLDAEARMLLDLMDKAVQEGRPKPNTLPCMVGRAAVDKMLEDSEADPSEVAAVEDGGFAGPAGKIGYRHYRPLGLPSGPLPTLIYYHGGGFVAGTLETHDSTCRRLANKPLPNCAAADRPLNHRPTRQQTTHIHKGESSCSGSTSDEPHSQPPFCRSASPRRVPPPLSPNWGGRTIYPAPKSVATSITYSSALAMLARCLLRPPPRPVTFRRAAVRTISASPIEDADRLIPPCVMAMFLRVWSSYGKATSVDEPVTHGNKPIRAACNKPGKHELV
jgi:alpha/beta hydrolase fold